MAALTINFKVQQRFCLQALKHFKTVTGPANIMLSGKKSGSKRVKHFVRYNQPTLVR